MDALKLREEVSKPGLLQAVRGVFDPVVGRKFSIGACLISRGGGTNGIRISGKGSWSLRMSCNRLIYGKIFGSFGILQKNTYVSAWVMAIYA